MADRLDGSARVAFHRRRSANVYQINPPQRKITFKPVYSTDPTHENKSFWDATPQGDLSMTIDNPSAAEFFKPGLEYYIDFSEAPPTPPNVYPQQIATK